MNDIKQYLCDTLGVDDQEQSELYQEVYGYARQECEELLESDASDEVKDKVDVELKALDNISESLQDFFKHYKLSDFIIQNLKREGMSEEDITYVLDMLNDETYIKFMQSYNASLRVYTDLIVGLIDAGVEHLDNKEENTTYKQQLH